MDFENGRNTRKRARSSHENVCKVTGLNTDNINIGSSFQVPRALFLQSFIENVERQIIHIGLGRFTSYDE